MNQYLDELYGWIASEDPTFKSRYPNQDDWNEKMQDPEYAKKMHSWISSIDRTFAARRPIDNFLESVKKRFNRFGWSWGGGFYGPYYITRSRTYFFGVAVVSVNDKI